MISAQVLAARTRDLARDGVHERHVKDPLASFTLGRLLLRGTITREQYETAERVAAVFRRHAVIHGYKLNIHTPSFVMVGGGGEDCREPPSEEEIARVGDLWTKYYNALMKCGETPAASLRSASVFHGVCLLNWPVARLDENPGDYGLLRAAINALSGA